MEVEELQNNIKSILTEKQVRYEIKKMFGGLCFMVDSKMCFGVYKPKNTEHPKLIARVGEHFYKSALEQPFCSEFDLTGRPMKGYVFVTPDGFDTDTELAYWLNLCLAFNPSAKASKKKRK